MEVELVKSLIAKGMSVESEATGLSMFPLLLPHARVTIEPVQRQLQRGDIVSFVRYDSTETKLVLHRVIKVTDTEIITRGDACLHNDKPVKIVDIIGVLTKSKWWLITLNHKRWIWKIYGKLVLLLSPVSHTVNYFFAHLCYKIFRPLRQRANTVQ